MNADNPEQKSKQVVIWIIAVAVTLVAFYFMDHFIMSIQGLPLNWNLTPAQ